MAAAAAATSLLLRRHRRTPAPLPLLLRAAISYTRPLPQQPELSPPASDPAASSPLPPNPSSGSPFYGENWRNPAAPSSAASSNLPAVINPSPNYSNHRLAGAAELKEIFAEYTTGQKWEDMKNLFVFWARSLDVATGKPNRPDADLFNHYLRANLMSGALPHEMLDLADQMRDFQITPNTASFNLVLKSMVKAREVEGGEKLFDR
jgi:hypothetical protein